MILVQSGVISGTTIGAAQVSGGEDYRLQQHRLADTTLPEILDNASSQRTVAKELRQGVMQIGREGDARLDAVWAEVAKSGASQVL